MPEHPFSLFVHKPCGDVLSVGVRFQTNPFGLEFIRESIDILFGDYFIMYSETAEGYPNGSRWSVSLNAENKDSYTDVVAGDEVVMYYDGMAMETDPLQVSKVYAITLKVPADRSINDKQ